MEDSAQPDARRFLGRVGKCARQAGARLRLLPSASRHEQHRSSRLFIESIDVLFVDGLHSFEGAMADLVAYWPKLKPRHTDPQRLHARSCMPLIALSLSGIRKAACQFLETKGLAHRIIVEGPLGITNAGLVIGMELARGNVSNTCALRIRRRALACAYPLWTYTAFIGNSRACTPLPCARVCVVGMVVALFSAAAAGAPASSAAQGVVPNSHVWDGTRWTCATDCDEVPCNRSARASSSPMQAQFDRNGFVILRDVLPSSVVDTMANSVNEYIARRGPMLTSRSIAFPGYLVLGVHREPPLYHLFEWLHGSRSLHAALAHIFDRDSPAPTKHGEGHGEGPKDTAWCREQS